MEDKQEILESLCGTLQKTRQFDDLTCIQYEKREDGEEFAVAEFAEGCTKRICVSCDSGYAMIKDVLSGLA